MENAWARHSWRTFSIRQAPVYPDPDALLRVERRLASLPPVVFPHEVQRLKQRLAKVASGEAFLLQGGDCAESFADSSVSKIANTVRLLFQIALVLEFGTQKEVVKVARIGGQFAKPRSQETETLQGQTLLSYRGDMINGHAFDSKSRTPDPARMETAYVHSASTLDALRTEGAEIFTSHEALLLNYEGGMTRPRSRAESTLGFVDEGEWFAGSGHMLWLRRSRWKTRRKLHVEYLRGI